MLFLSAGLSPHMFLLYIVFCYHSVISCPFIIMRVSLLFYFAVFFQ